MTQEKQGTNKRGLAAIITAAILAAVPGFYSAWQTAKVEYQQRTASKKVQQTGSQGQEWVDNKEKRYRKDNKALEDEIAAVKRTAGTHKEVLDLGIKLQQRQKPKAGYRQRSFQRAQELYLRAKIKELRQRMAAAKVMQSKSTNLGSPRPGPPNHPRSYFRSNRPPKKSLPKK